MTTNTLSERAQEVLLTIIDTPSKSAVDIAAALGVSVGSVASAISTLKKQELIIAEEGKFTATDEAIFTYGATTTVPSTPVLTMAEGAPAVEAAEVLASAPTAVTNYEDIRAKGEALVVNTHEAEIPAVAVVAEIPAVAVVAEIPAVATVAAVVESKAAKARRIFDANKDQPRKVLMALMMGPEVGLTAPGANTYIHNFRKLAGMVTARGTKVEPVVGVVATTETPAFVPAATENVVVDLVVPTASAEVVEVTEVKETTAG